MNEKNIINFIQTHTDARGQLVSILNTIKEEGKSFMVEVNVGKQLKNCFKMYLTSVSSNPNIALNIKGNDNDCIRFVSDKGVSRCSPTLLYIPLRDGAISDLSVDYGYKVGLNFTFKNKVDHVDYMVEIRFDN